MRYYVEQLVAARSFAYVDFKKKTEKFSYFLFSVGILKNSLSMSNLHAEYSFCHSLSIGKLNTSYT